MSIVIFTDPHIGTKRTTGTTPDSRKKLQQAILDTLYSFLPEEQDYDHFYVCAGDVFDTYSNPEEVLAQGRDIMRRCDMVIAGNHDVIPIADKKGSLEYINETEKGGAIIVHAPFGKVWVQTEEMDSTLVTGVAHTTTQELFELSLDKAIENRTAASMELPAILVLHCNFESPHDLTETSLNLTEGRAAHLLEYFDYIFLGHEHQPRDLFGGRLVILGNTHPTSFSDISDKRIAIVDNVGGNLQVNFKEIWNASQHYSEHDVSDIALLPMATTGQFIRLTGQVPSDQLGQVAKAVKKLWKDSPNLIALRSEVQVTGATEIDSTAAEATAETLPALISRELASDPSMKAMWEEFTGGN